jgi:hypothetical protein
MSSLLLAACFLVVCAPQKAHAAFAMVAPVNITCGSLATTSTTVGASPGFNQPRGAAFDTQSSNLFIADTSNHRVLSMAPNCFTALLAGSGAGALTDGTAAAAAFNMPRNLAVASDGTVFVADNNNAAIRAIAAGGVVLTLIGAAPPTKLSGWVDAAGNTARLNGPWGVCLDNSGAMYIADYTNHAIRKGVIAGATVTTVFGFNPPTPTPGWVDGLAAVAKLNKPSGVFFANGIVYVTEYGNCAVRKFDVATVTLSTLTGLTAGGCGFRDGVGTTAQFSSPHGVVVDGDFLYVVDKGNKKLRAVNIADQTVSTFLDIPDTFFGIALKNSAMFIPMYQGAVLGYTVRSQSVSESRSATRTPAATRTCTRTATHTATHTDNASPSQSQEDPVTPSESASLPPTASAIPPTTATYAATRTGTLSVTTAVPPTTTPVPPPTTQSPSSRADAAGSSGTSSSAASSAADCEWCVLVVVLALMLVVAACFVGACVLCKKKAPPAKEHADDDHETGPEHAASQP